MVVYSAGQSSSICKTYSWSPNFYVACDCDLTTCGGQRLQENIGQIKVQEEKKTEQTQEEWMISIIGEIEKAAGDDDTTIWDKLCIYRVPHYLQGNNNNNASYFPQTVSLGPYHHGRVHLAPMEHHKWRAVYRVTKRFKQSIEMYIDAMKDLEEMARACYQASFEMDSYKFVQMLVLDGCFVLELFRGAVDGFPQIGYARNDPVFAMRGSMHSIQRDMVMMENQLPMFVLNRLLEIQLGMHHQTGKVAEVAAWFFKPLMPTTKGISNRDQLKLMNWHEKVDYVGEMHCLDVIHRSLIPTFRSKLRPDRIMLIRNMSMVDKRQQQLIHCVTELREAGVKFRSKKTDQLWDIKFRNGYLEIPKLLIHDGTKSLFSNLIAFEQCHIHSGNNITSYIIFMDNLINSSEDVSYLHHCGIIEHWLGNHSEVADLFNQLCKEVVFDPKDSYLSNLSGEVNRYYSFTWNSLKASLRHKYFNNPWAYLSFFAAVTLLFLTLSQSFFAIYAYYRPPS